MFIDCKLVLINYMPDDELEIGMLFSRIVDDSYQVYELDKIPNDQKAYIVEHGFPVHLNIIWEGNPNLDEMEIMATHEEIGWFDEGDESDELTDITIKQINKILTDDGDLEVEISGDEINPILYNGKVVIRVAKLAENASFNDEEDEEEYENMCSLCSGTGEGPFPDTRCMSCGGSGEGKSSGDDFDFDYD
jgi:hypothetical protein